MTDQPKAIEPMPVQLTRIEGSVNLIAERVGNVQGQIGDLRTEVTHLSGRVAVVELAQAASSGASTSWKTWIPILVGIAGVAIAFTTFTIALIGA